MFGEANAMGIVLKGGDQVKLKYLTAATTALRSSGKSTYAMLLRFFYEEDGSRSDFVVKAFLSYRISWFVLPRRYGDG